MNNDADLIFIAVWQQMICFSNMAKYSVSSLCARGKSSIARKPEDIPTFLIGKKTFKKCNPSDFKFYLSKLSDKKNFPK